MIFLFKDNGPTLGICSPPPFSTFQPSPKSRLHLYPTPLPMFQISPLLSFLTFPGKPFHVLCNPHNISVSS